MVSCSRGRRFGKSIYSFLVGGWGRILKDDVCDRENPMRKKCSFLLEALAFTV